MGQFVPDVKCVLGESVPCQDAWRRGFELALTQRVLSLGATGFVSGDERAEWSASMEILSGGKNTILWVNDGSGGEGDPKFFPSIMVRIPAMRIQDVLGTGSNENLHPAFICNSKVNPYIHVGKYQASSIYSNSKHIGVSLYGVDVMGGGSSYTSLVGAQAMGGHPTYDTALQYCANGGTGFHLVTNAEWAAIALLCKNLLMFQPKGNNYYGREYSDPATPEYYGVPAYMYDSKVARVGAGTGLISWAHDGTPWGVFDLNGNVTEWVAGLRQVAGEVQVIGNNDAANYLFGDSDKDQGRESALWKAFSADGSLVTPECTIASGGTVTDTEAGATLKLQPGGVSGAQTVRLDLAVTNRTTGSVDCSFGDIAVDGVNVTSLPEVMVSLGLAPPAGGQSAAHGADRFYMRNDASGTYAETLARRGGSWVSTSSAGVFSLFLSYYRSYGHRPYGARPAFIGAL